MQKGAKAGRNAHLASCEGDLNVQINSKSRHDVSVTEADLLKIPQGPRTEACLRHNCVVGVQYLEAWLGGLGCVPLYNLMEDAATAEICRTQARTCLAHQFCFPCWGASPAAAPTPC